MVMVGALKIVEDATFMHLKVALQLAFLAEWDNKIEINDVSHGFFIKKMWHVICLNPKN
jgi:hypothetical protein